MKRYEFNMATAGRSTSTAEVKVPVVCPSCRSSDISTTSRKPDDNAYWRCDACGEVWNAGRRESGSGGRRRW